MWNPLRNRRIRKLKEAREWVDAEKGRLRSMTYNEIMSEYTLHKVASANSIFRNASLVIFYQAAAEVMEEGSFRLGQ